MKKTFLLLGVTTFFFSLLFAQQNEMPDIQKLVQKRLKEEQEQKLKELNPFFRKAENQTFLLAQDPPQAKLSHTLPDGSKVYLLPLDNMPCVVPDMKQYTNMPNALSQNKSDALLEYLKNKKMAGVIPNPAFPSHIIPKDGSK